MHYPFKRVPLSSIGLSVRWNLHPWALDDGPSTGPLQKSLSMVGILHPPLIMPSASEGDDKHEYTVVCGYRRLEYARNSLSNQDNLIGCLIVPSNTGPLQFLHTVLEDQLLSITPLSLAEKARFLEIASQYFDDKESVNHFGEKLGLKKSLSLLKDLRTLMKQPVEMIEAVHNGLIQQQILHELLSITEELDRLNLLRFFQLLQLGTGKQRRFFQLIRDLAYKNRLTISEFLDRGDIQRILSHQTLNIPQIIQHLGDHLQQLQQPLSHKAIRNFEEKVKALQLDKSLTITHVPYFEKDEVTLSISFDNLEACASYLIKSRKIRQ